MATNAMKLGLILSATDKMSRVVDQAVSKSNAKFRKFNNSIQSMNNASNRMLMGGAGIVAGLFATVKEAENVATSQARLDNVFKSMWGNTPKIREMSKAQGELADKIALTTGIDADAIRMTQAKLATFEAVSSKTAVAQGVFERATRASVDMQAAGFGDAATNAVMLGKALQDPLTMATAMKRTGALTDADVINIQKLTKSQGILAGQEAILKAVERQVKGTAEATANGTDIIGESFRQISAEIGTQFLPLVQKATNSIIKNLAPAKEWIKNNKDLIFTIAKIGAGLIAGAIAIRIFTTISSGILGVIRMFKAVNAVIKLVKSSSLVLAIAQKIVSVSTSIWATAQNFLNAAFLASPIGWIVLGITALVAVVVVAWKKFAGFRAVIKTAWSTIKQFGSILKDYVIDRIKGIISGLGSVGRAIGLLFKGKFKEAATEAKSGVKALSGYDAKMKAIGKTKKLVSNTSTTYKNILKQEQAAQKENTQTQSKAIPVITSTSKEAKTNVSTSKGNVLNYNPTINIASGSAEDKKSFMETLKLHKQEIARMIDEINSDKKRLSYS